MQRLSFVLLMSVFVASCAGNLEVAVTGNDIGLPSAPPSKSYDAARYAYLPYIYPSLQTSVPDSIVSRYPETVDLVREQIDPLLEPLVETAVTQQKSGPGFFSSPKRWLESAVANGITQFGNSQEGQQIVNRVIDTTLQKFFASPTGNLMNIAMASNIAFGVINLGLDILRGNGENERWTEFQKNQRLIYDVVVANGKKLDQLLGINTLVLNEVVIAPIKASEAALDGFTTEAALYGNLNDDAGRVVFIKNFLTSGFQARFVAAYDAAVEAHKYMKDTNSNAKYLHPQQYLAGYSEEHLTWSCWLVLTCGETKYHAIYENYQTTAQADLFSVNLSHLIHLRNLSLLRINLAPEILTGSNLLSYRKAAAQVDLQTLTQLEAAMAQSLTDLDASVVALANAHPVTTTGEAALPLLQSSVNSAYAQYVAIYASILASWRTVLQAHVLAGP